MNNIEILNKQMLVNKLSAVLGITKQDADFLYRLLPSSCCPKDFVFNMFRDEFINPLAGTVDFTLTYTPTTGYPEIVTRGGKQLLSSEYTIASNILTLINPISVTPGGAGGEDITITYSY